MHSVVDPRVASLLIVSSILLSVTGAADKNKLNHVILVKLLLRW